MIDKSAKIYIAGHCGLAGSAIRENLESKGYANILCRTHQELDLLDGAAVKKFFDEEKPEYVILAAARVGGIMANSFYRADFIYENLQIQQNVIGESFRNGVRKLVFLGSTCIYPKKAAQPITEDSLLSGELEYSNEPYAVAKIAGLKLCESLNLQYGTNYISVMPSNLYGPNDNFHLGYGHVIPEMMRKIHLSGCLMRGDWDAVRLDLNRRPVGEMNGSADAEDILSALSRYGIFSNRTELMGTGSPVRDFLWSRDMADACVHILERVDFSDIIGIKQYSISQTGIRSDDAGFGSEHYGEIRNCHINIGTGREIEISEIAKLIAKTVEYFGQILFDPTKPDGVSRKIAAVSKLHSFGWHHKVEIEEGIPKLYTWYLENLKG